MLIHPWLHGSNCADLLIIYYKLLSYSYYSYAYLIASGERHSVAQEQKGPNTREVHIRDQGRFWITCIKSRLAYMRQSWNAQHVCVATIITYVLYYVIGDNLLYIMHCTERHLHIFLKNLTGRLKSCNEAMLLKSSRQLAPLLIWQTHCHKIHSRHKIHSLWNHKAS